MKRKFLILSCTTILCLSLTSCGLKDAITGNNETTGKTIKTPTTNSENKDNIKNTESTDDTNVNADDNTSNTDSTNDSDDAVLTNNNSFLESSDSASNVTSDKAAISSTSKSVKRDCRVFYFNKVDLKTYCVDTSVTVTDNAFVTALTQELYSAPNGNENFFVLSKDYGVSSATLNYDTNILTVVFNENFIKAMELSTEVANGVVASIVNTYGYNYGVTNVAVYFGDELYTGLEGTSDNGYSKVDYSSTLKLN